MDAHTGQPSAFDPHLVFDQKDVVGINIKVQELGRVAHNSVASGTVLVNMN